MIEEVILCGGVTDDSETVRGLIGAGANRTIADWDDVTPLQQAETRGYNEIAEILRWK
jgi:uncharacterized protein